MLRAMNTTTTPFGGSLSARPATTRILRGALVLACAWLLAACSTLNPKLESPDLEVLGIQMLSTDMFAQKFRVRVRVTNPNDLELAVKGIEYQIILMGDSFAEGNSTDRFVLPALGEAEFDMAITTNFVSSFGRLLSRVGGGKLENLDYEITGHVMLDKGLVKKIPFSKSGQVDLTRPGRKGS
jgi:LEA14-like dessication related protein